MTAEQEMLSLLRRIADCLDGMRLQLARPSATAALSNEDADAAEALFQSLATSNLRSLVFVAREALAHVAHQDDAALKARLLPVVGDLTLPSATRRLGKLLSRVEGVVIADHRIVRCGDSRDGVIWNLGRG